MFYTFVDGIVTTSLIISGSSPLFGQALGTERKTKTLTSHISHFGIAL